MIPELLYLALDFYREPRRFTALRDPHAPLPPGIGELLAAPANCLGEDRIGATAARLNASVAECRDCVPFFIKQVLLETEGDYYRVLGLSRDAGQEQVKTHYFYLMRLFHPDRDVHNEGWDTLYAPRINEAYNTLRNPEKRGAYDQSLLPLAEGGAVPSAAAPARRFDEPVAGGGRRSFLRSPWLAAGLALWCVGGLAALLFNAGSTPQLTVGKPQAEGVPAAFRSVDEVRAEYEVDAGSEPEPGPSEPARELAVAAAPEPARALSDEQIEALVQARVAQASRAVLGAPRPEPKLKPKANPTPEPTPEPTRAPRVVAQPEPVVAEAPVAEARPEPEPAAEQHLALAPPVEPVAEDMPESVTAETQPKAAPETQPAPPQPEFKPAPQPAAEPASVPEPESRAEPAPIPEPEPAPQPEPEPVTRLAALSDAELRQVLERFASLYEAEDAAAFAALFTEHAETTDASGRGTIRALYDDFFRSVEVRGFEFERVRLKGRDALERSARGQAVITTVPAAGGETSVVEVAIDFTLRRTADGGVGIAGMHY